MIFKHQKSPRVRYYYNIHVEWWSFLFQVPNFATKNRSSPYVGTRSHCRCPPRLCRSIRLLPTSACHCRPLLGADRELNSFPPLRLVCFDRLTLNDMLCIARRTKEGERGTRKETQGFSPIVRLFLPCHVLGISLVGA